MSDEMVEVLIRAECKIEYQQIVKMTKADFASYEAACENMEDDKWFDRWAERFLNPSDICDQGPFEDVEAELHEAGND